MMKTKLGIVGPRDSVNLICELARDFDDQVIIIPYIYTHVDETVGIVQDGENEVDVWLFSGQVPYAIANEQKLSHKSFYPQLNGSSLAKVLLDISYKDQKKLDRISLDTVPSDEIYETFNELHLPTEGLHLLPYTGYKPLNEIIAFHFDLYNKQKVDVCVTYIHSVYKELKERGVPVYRITPTRMIIRQTIQSACQEGETLHFKKSQISVFIIQIYDMNKLIGENETSYKIHRLNLKLQELILDYTESIFASFVSLGNGKFIIFSTRGSFENQLKYHPSLLIEKIIFMTELSTNIGIGYGTTSLGAEQNAHLALYHAKNHGENCTILVNENGSIEGPLQKPNSVTYDYRTENKEISDKLKKAGVNISTFNKILYIQKQLDKSTISAANVAEWLGMTQRNARRILSDLEKQGLAQEIGEETPSTRGRPRKVYQVGQ
jgi:hypothetical protein